MSIDRWCRAIAKLPKGRVLLRNLLYDVERRRIPRSVVRQLFEHLTRRLPQEDDAETNNGLDAEEAALWVDRFRQNDVETRTCAGQKKPSQPEPCSRVVDESSCLKFNFRHDFLGLPNDDEPPPAWLFEVIASRPLEKEALRGEMTTGRGFTWVTRSQELAELTEAQAHRRADAVRQGLGLNHLRAGMRLVAIHYPNNLPWSHRHGPPTAIEGGADAVYRSRQHEDGWGRAVDLDSLEDGLPELTHEPVAFDDSFRLETLGSIREEPQPSEDELADAAAPLSDEWLEASIERLVDHHRRVLP